MVGWRKQGVWYTCAPLIVANQPGVRLSSTANDKNGVSSAPMATLSRQFPTPVRVVAVIIALALAKTAFAGTGELTEPVFQSNQQVFDAVFGLPPAETARLASGDRFRVVEAIANTYVGSRHGGERIYLDGETARTTLVWRHGFDDRWQVGVDLPWVHHGGGVFDGVIDSWHRFWGFGRGGRDDVGNGNLVYYYSRDGRTLVDVQHSGGGVGDVRLTGAWQWWRGAGRALAVQTAVKLATGDSDHLYGSGGADGSAALAWRDETSLAAWRLVYELSGGILATQTGDVLPHDRRRAAAFGHAMLAWRIAPRAALKAQIDAHTALYHSHLREIGRGSVQLTLAVDFALARRWSVEAGLVEDAWVDTAPDAVFHFAVRYTPGT